VTFRQFLKLVTRTTLPKGRLLCAAVSARCDVRSPLAVRALSELGLYQLAMPIWV
jgi:hypothetical protein